MLEFYFRSHFLKQGTNTVVKCLDNVLNDGGSLYGGIFIFPYLQHLEYNISLFTFHYNIYKYILAFLDTTYHYMLLLDIDVQPYHLGNIFLFGFHYYWNFVFLFSFSFFELFPIFLIGYFFIL
ncbi:hypothetical protein ACJX0J_009131, partial [Zea mays]